RRLARASAEGRPLAAPVLAQHRLAQAQSLVRGGGDALAAPPGGGDPGVMIRRALARVAAAVLVLLAASCAPLQQSPQAPRPSFTGPRLEQSDFVSFDGAKLG